MASADLPSTTPRIRHQGPPAGMPATLYTVLFLIGLWPVTIFGGRPYFPGPWESASTIVRFFEARPQAVLECVFFQFGAAVALAIFTATVVNQMRFLGVQAAGVNIALFGGLMTVFDGFASAFGTWAMVQSHAAGQSAAVTTAFYYFSFASGGPGFSVPMGLLMLGISIPAMLMKLLPKWVTILGLVLGVSGELSWFNFLFPQALFLIPLTRFPGMLWLIAAGFLLPRTVAVGRSQQTATAF
jgi:hypothetical protein